MDEQIVRETKKLLDLYQAFNKSTDSECGGKFTICIIFVKSCCKFNRIVRFGGPRHLTN